MTEQPLQESKRVRWAVSLEMACTDDGEFDAVRFRVECPHCGRKGSPLVSRLTERLRHYTSWVGLSYLAPMTDYRTRCPGCKGVYEFTGYWPQ